MSSTKDIQRRIKSVKNTKKITKAMEMVASAKLRKAIRSVEKTRPYANMAWQILQNISAKTDARLHALLQKSEAQKNIGLIVITANRGLCGSFNQQVIKKVQEFTKGRDQDLTEIVISTLGTVGAKTLVKRGYNLEADYAKADVTNDSLEIRPLANAAIEFFLEKKYDAVYMVYTDFISSLKQEVRVRQLLPLQKSADLELGAVSTEDRAEKIQFDSGEYLFEPAPQAILDNLLPRLLEVQLYQAALESNASEHSARMAAMRNASEAANDMIDELTLIYNQVRQASITNEIAEIASGKAALE